MCFHYIWEAIFGLFGSIDLYVNPMPLPDCPGYYTYVSFEIRQYSYFDSSGSFAFPYKF